jgi:glutaredoxin-like protein NrdH
MTPVVTVYSKPQCVQCTATYRALDSRKVDYVVEDILSEGNAPLLAEFKERGLNSAPVVVLTHPETGAVLDEWSGLRPDTIGAHFGK